MALGVVALYMYSFNEFIEGVHFYNTYIVLCVVKVSNYNIHCIYYNSAETSSKPVVDKCNMIQIHGDIETNTVSETNSDIKDTSEKERVQEGQGDSDNELCSQEIQG